MSFKINTIQQTENHRWAVIHCYSNLNDNDDTLLNYIIDKVQEAYGEGRIMAYAQTFTTPDPLVTHTFNLEAIQQAIRMGLPNPASEGKKPPHLTIYRSETAEMLAWAGLSVAYNIQFPVAPQLGKPNPNQPILGFDGWGLYHNNNNEYTLVLVQVKGTEDKRRPPRIAHTLVTECQKAPTQLEAIARALSILIIYLQGSNIEPPLQTALLTMLEKLGQGQLPNLIIAPVIIRGEITAHIDDLKPIQQARHSFAPIIAWGLSLSIGVNLNEFGKAVMLGARKL